MTDEFGSYDPHSDSWIGSENWPFVEPPACRAGKVRNLAAYLAGAGVGVLLLIAIFRVTT